MDAAEKMIPAFEMESDKTEIKQCEFSDESHGGNNVTNLENCLNENNDLGTSQVLKKYVSLQNEASEQVCSSTESDISDDEIEDMLEESLERNTSYKSEGGQSLIQYKEHEIVTLDELWHNQCGPLPEDWIKVTHESGMPVYVHRPTRVCTLTRPFELSEALAKTHEVPLSAIPCLQYKKALEENAAKVEDTVQESELIDVQQAKIETAEKNEEIQSLTPLAVQQYCKSLFRFRTVSRLKFSSLSNRGKKAKEKKTEELQRQPTFSGGPKLVKCYIRDPKDGPNAKPSVEYILSSTEKSSIGVLHEYAQKVLKKQPSYEFRPLENPATPYSASVLIDGMRYGYGSGPTKKQAKLSATSAALEILVPTMREKIKNKKIQENEEQSEAEATMALFDQVNILDPRVTEISVKLSEPLPYSMLMTCLQYNFDKKDMPIEYKMKSNHRKRNDFVMTVGSYTARVTCKNKKEGKQKASQFILQKLHPYISSWGSLLRLYGDRVIKKVKDKKRDKTKVQSQAFSNSPNYDILNKLRAAMIKLEQKKKKINPPGKFISPDNINLPSTSGTQLRKKVL